MADPSPWLLVGLGNPGPNHADNRHNVGFMAVDAWMDAYEPFASWRARWQGEVASSNGSCGRVTLAKPQTYMNESGLCVSQAARFFQVPPERLIVVHDELELELGNVIIKSGGGHGGHNGLRDIEKKTGSRNFVRIRIGIGRPDRGSVSNWVLSDFSSTEQDELDRALHLTVSAIRGIMKDGVKSAMSQFNPN